MAIRAIVGLGNPGPKYYKTRHSIGFRVIDALADAYYGSWHSKDNLEYAEVTIHNHSIILVKPQTYMNTSGQAIPFLTKKGIKPEEIMVVHDEMEIPFGSVKIRLGGSHRGHNGLRSLIGVIGADFWRVRVGVDRPADRDQVSDYVLAPFSEKPDQVEQLIATACAEIEKQLQ